MPWLNVKRLWDDTCPECGKKLDIYEAWVGDYGTEFETECPHCETALHVEVESVPEFGVAKAAEYKAAEREHHRKMREQTH